MSATLTIGQLAKLGQVNLETIRFYEREGLLPPPPRSQSGYRAFPQAAVRQLRFIRRAQELGFSLAEIRELLALKASRTAIVRRCAAKPERNSARWMRRYITCKR